MFTARPTVQERQPQSAVTSLPHRLGLDTFGCSYLEWPNPVEIRAAKPTGSGRGGGM